MILLIVLLFSGRFFRMDIMYNIVIEPALSFVFSLCLLFSSALGYF
jgi:hypothetical protein